MLFFKQVFKTYKHEVIGVQSLSLSFMKSGILDLNNVAS